MKVGASKVKGFSWGSLTRTRAKRAAAEARAESLARLGLLLSAARDPVNAAQYIVNAAFKLLRWDASFLVLYDDKRDRVSDLINIDTVNGTRQRVPAVLENKPPSPMMRKVLQEGPQLVLRARQEQESGAATVPFGDTVRLSLSLMFVPVRLEERCIGVLSVQSYEPGAYNQSDLELLQGLANHAAGALGRLQAEEELRANEEHLRLALNSSGMGTWEYAPAVDQFTVSETFASILGIGPEEPISFEDFLSRLQAVGAESGQSLRDLLKRGSDAPVRIECRVRRADRTERWVILAAKRFVGSRGRLADTARLIGTVLDITGRKQVEEALRAAQEELTARAEDLEKTVKARTARLQETVDELEHVSYALKHDMRAPLRAMQVYAQLAQEEIADSNPRVLEFLGQIRMASKRLDLLIQDSLSYNAAVLGDLALEPVALGPLLLGLVKTYPQFQAGEAEIHLAKDLPVVLGTEAALTQCFANLLDNAVKFVQPGSRAFVRVSVEARGDFVRVWVEDQGIGIAGTCQSRIFRMFERGTKEYEGTGIGLAIVSKLVQRMGGRLGVESEEGHGSRFWVELQAGSR